MNKETIKEAVDQRFIEVIGMLRKSNPDLTDPVLGKQIGMSPSNIGDVRHGRRSVTMTALILLRQFYPDVNLNYILLGEGEPFLPPTPNPTPIATPIPKIPTQKVEDAEIIDLNDDRPAVPMEYITGKTIRILPIQVDPETNRERITMVSTKVAAGYIDHLHEIEYIRRLPGFNLPLPVFNSGTFRCFEVTGESMSKGLMPGHIVFARFVDDFLKIKNGLVYVVAYRGEQRPVIKRIKNKINSLGKLILQSDNKDYPTYSVDIDDVKEAWEYVAHLEFGVPRTGHEIAVDVNNLKDEVYLLQEEMKNLKRMLDK